MHKFNKYFTGKQRTKIKEGERLEIRTKETFSGIAKF